MHVLKITELPKTVTDLFMELIKNHTTNILMSIPPKYKNSDKSVVKTEKLHLKSLYNISLPIKEKQAHLLC